MWIVETATSSIWSATSEPSVHEEEYDTEQEAMERVDDLEKHPIDYFDHIRVKVVRVYKKEDNHVHTRR